MNNIQKLPWENVKEKSLKDLDEMIANTRVFIKQLEIVSDPAAPLLIRAYEQQIEYFEREKVKLSAIN